MKINNLEHKKILLRKILNCIIFAIVAFSCAYLWNVFFAGSRVPATIISTQNVTTVQKVKPQYKHARIADIKVGERVVASADDTPKPTAVASATWKKITLYAEETWYDGTVDSINVVTLVSPEWIALHDAKIGSMVPIPLDVQEMGLDENLLAKITAIEQCPEIRAGHGRVVLTTVNHLSRGVCALTYTNSAGQSETIRPTASHRFYSLDRKDWIHIGDANKGERLQGFGNDIITVVSCQPLDKTERVYNMTVEDEHVYHVGKLNLLAHNNFCANSRSDAFRQIKKDLGIPMSQQPIRVEHYKLTNSPSSGNSNMIDPNTGLPVITRIYYFNLNGREIQVQEHSIGHYHEPRSHFNVRYSTDASGDTRGPYVEGARDHYFFPGTYNPFSD